MASIWTGKKWWRLAGYVLLVILLSVSFMCFILGALSITLVDFYMNPKCGSGVCMRTMYDVPILDNCNPKEKVTLTGVFSLQVEKKSKIQ